MSVSLQDISIVLQKTGRGQLLFLLCICLFVLIYWPTMLHLFQTTHPVTFVEQNQT